MDAARTALVQWYQSRGVISPEVVTEILEAADLKATVLRLAREKKITPGTMRTILHDVLNAQSKPLTQGPAFDEETVLGYVEPYEPSVPLDYDGVIERHVKPFMSPARMSDSRRRRS